jgi:hypothetical protein
MMDDTTLKTLIHVLKAGIKFTEAQIEYDVHYAVNMETARYKVQIPYTAARDILSKLEIK